MKRKILLLILLVIVCLLLTACQQNVWYHGDFGAAAHIMTALG